MIRKLLILCVAPLLVVGCGESLSKTPKKSTGSNEPVLNNATNNTHIVKGDEPETADCGNGVVEGTEVCDGSAVSTCTELGFDDGVVTCTVACTEDTSTCVRYSCGDGVLQVDEACDDGSLNGQPGRCSTNCSGVTPACGDGIVGPDELCDDGGNNGAYGHCNVTCDGVEGYCGDGVIQPQEECDGSVPSVISCSSLGLGRGTVSCSSTCQVMAMCTMTPASGEVIFSEIMANPDKDLDNDGEWFEMYNTTGRTVDLSGCVVESATSTGQESFAISSLVVAPGAYVTFARSANAPFVASYTYNGNINLNNTSDSLRLKCTDGVAQTIDFVAWDDGATFPDPVGASLSLSPSARTASANDNGANWCTASSMYGNGDLGTPGMPNDSCF